MTAAKFIFRSLWKVKYYTLATFGLFALSRVFIYLDNYCIAALFGYVGTHPEQAFSSAALSWLAVYAALHFGSNIADGVYTFLNIVWTSGSKKISLSACSGKRTNIPQPILQPKCPGPYPIKSSVWKTARALSSGGSKVFWKASSFPMPWLSRFCFRLTAAWRLLCSFSASPRQL